MPVAWVIVATCGLWTIASGRPLEVDPSKAQIEGAYAAFTHIDTNRDQKLEANEFADYMTSLGQPIDPKDLDTAMQTLFGTDNVDFQTFLKGYIKLQNSEETLHASFDLLDKDGSGEISQEELNQLLNKSGLLTEEGKKLIFETVDKDGSKGLNFEEFTELQRVG